MSGFQTTWFVLITVLWTGFFVLEGFDFGVGMLTPVLGRSEEERVLIKETTGPFWDGNEVWLVVAGGATFAAFPDWYATMFSAYYLPLFLVLVALILRATGLEYRNRRTSPVWRARWDWVVAAACLAVPLLIGTALGGLLGGLPINQDKEFTDNFLDLVQPYALLNGVLFTALCVLQGVLFIRMKTTGEVAEQAYSRIRWIGLVVVLLTCVHLVWTQVVANGTVPGLAAWLALIFAVAAAWLARERGHLGMAFTASSGTIVFTVVSLFSTLYPDTMVSTTNPDYSLTVSDSSGEYTLKLMTIVALVMVPVVLIYTAWSYWVFRTRVTGKPTSRTTAHDVIDAQVLQVTAPAPAPEGPAAGAAPES